MGAWRSQRRMARARAPASAHSRQTKGQSPRSCSIATSLAGQPTFGMKDLPDGAGRGLGEGVGKGGLVGGRGGPERAGLLCSATQNGVAVGNRHTGHQPA